MKMVKINAESCLIHTERNVYAISSKFSDMGQLLDKRRQILCSIVSGNNTKILVFARDLLYWSNVFIFPMNNCDGESHRQWSICCSWHGSGFGICYVQYSLSIEGGLSGKFSSTLVLASVRKTLTNQSVFWRKIPASEMSFWHHSKYFYLTSGDFPGDSACDSKETTSFKAKTWEGHL